VLRLTWEDGSDSPSFINYREGRLELYYELSSGYYWIPFCYDYFNSSAADLACKQLGYTGASKYGTVEELGQV